MSAVTAPLLSVRDLRVEFESHRGTVRVLDDVSFDLAPGEILGVVGESGAGKSMAGAAVIGLVPPPGRLVAGSVALDGERIDTLRGEDLRRVRGRRIATVFQDPLTSLNPVYTIGRHLTETIRTHLPVDAAEARRRALALLTEVEIPEPATRFDQYPHQFSGGMRQRVAIALALCAEPRLLIADEPTTALDVSVQAQVIRVLRRVCRERGTAVLLITHDMGVIAETADRVMVMYQGRVLETGSVRAVLGAPQAPYTRALMAAIPSARRRLHRLPVPAIGSDLAAPAALPPAEPERSEHGRSEHERAAPVEAAPLLQVQGLARVFSLPGGGWLRRLRGAPPRELRAVDGVDFAIPRGSTFGLVGESGSGKSTVARMVAGLTRPTAGQVLFEGVDRWARGAPLDALRRRFQMVFQDPYASQNPRWRVDELIDEPVRVLGLASGADEVAERVAEALRRVRMSPDDARKYPHQVSGGQRQRIAIARALASRPAFIVCDEPTSALDVSVQAQVLNLMRDLQEEFGLTYLLISHNLAVVRHMCDAVGVMQRGRLVEQGPADAVLDAPQHPYTQALLAAVPELGR